MTGEKKPRYFVASGEGRLYFDTPDEFLAHLQGNDPVEAGCELMIDSEYAAFVTEECDPVPPAPQAEARP